MILNGLETSDRFPELDSFFDLRDDHIQDLLSGAAHLSTFSDRRLKEHFFQQRPTAIDLSEEIFPMGLNSVEGNLT